MKELTKEDFIIKAGQDPIIEALKVLKLPLTRQNYLELSYLDGIPESSAELEESLPAEIIDTTHLHDHPNAEDMNDDY
jgi:hypothetical protein